MALWGVIESQFYSKLSRILTEFAPDGAKYFSGEKFELKFSPQVLDLPNSILESAQSCIESLYKVCHESDYVSRARASLPEHRRWALDVDAQPSSALMSFDFHSDAESRLHLIEINTNASSFLFSDVLYRAHGLPPAASPRDPRIEILETFKQEFSQAQKLSASHLTVGIVDENPTSQAMFGEFLLYAALFREAGWNARILDLRDLRWDGRRLLTVDGLTLDAVYCRATDFFFEEPASLALKSAYQARSVPVTPHPKEYALMSDKSRLVELSRPNGLIDSHLSQQQLLDLKSCLIPSFSISDFESREQLWSERKGLFFKPRALFGGKSVYRGQSISKRVFDRILEEDPIIQSFVPAPTDPEGWKFDLRFFVYQNRVQLAVARRYQGQVTNFNTPLGGLMAIRWN